MYGGLHVKMMCTHISANSPTTLLCFTVKHSITPQLRKVILWNEEFHVCFISESLCSHDRCCFSLSHSHTDWSLGQTQANHMPLQETQNKENGII